MVFGISKKQKAEASASSPATVVEKKPELLSWTSSYAPPPPRRAPEQTLFRSRKINRNDWTPPNLFSASKRGRRAKRFDCLLTLAGLLLGVGLLAMILTLGILDWSKDQHKLCLVLDEDFDGPLNTDLWKHEVRVGGFGNREFDWTTTSPNNSYTRDGKLYIRPTLTADLFGPEAVMDGYTVNLTADGTCTAPPVPWTDRSGSTNLYEQAVGNADVNCQITSNRTLGTILPPVQSARLTTNGTFSLRYGRIEVRARMPVGDWIWPAVWMMPRDSVYGTWPRSGEIDIFEGKGNRPASRSDLLGNTMSSTLHIGTEPALDQYARFRAVSTLWRHLWYDGFHTFGLEWDEAGIWTWRGSRARRVLNVRFDRPFHTKMPPVQENGVVVPGEDPWSLSNATGAPFDQEFYLILNVAVGGTNGYFSDAGQPWSNGDPVAATTFWNARSSWLPTWGQGEDRAMAVDYIKAWKHC